MMDTASRNWALSAHFSGAALSFFAPTFGWVGPALVLLINQGDRDIVRHARAAFQFQFLMAATVWLIGVIGAGLSCFLFGPVLWLLGLIPFLASIAFGLIATIAVHNGDRYNYPLIGGPLPS